ncbi:hypothetical protein VNI00_014065 [Paramarasmius palmivorus]|uniref:Uncharacterized protein n=1 Tax=Paramarasmius palmivorus TaxID=297713 RepID=A0AAW0BU83_9AGAR
MTKKGLKTTIRKLLFSAILLMFIISTIYWGFKISNLLEDLQRLKTITGDSEFPETNHSVVQIFAALALINYVLTDGVVLWRVWVLCSMDYRRLLYVPIFFLFCCSFTVVSTVAIRITIETVPPDSSARPRLNRAIDVCQVSNLGFSLLINLSTTIILGLKTWRYRRWLMEDLRAIQISKRTRGERVLVLLIESGLLYCISGTIALISTIIRLPHGTVGDFYTPVNIQIAGIYPIVVLLLVSRGQSLDQTVFNHTGGPPGHARESDLGSIRFNAPSSTISRRELSLRLACVDEERGETKAYA